jgi:hypothetical protein
MLNVYRAFFAELEKMSAAEPNTPTMDRAVYDPARGVYVDSKNPEGGVWLFHGAPPERVNDIKKGGLRPVEAAVHNLGRTGTSDNSGVIQRSDLQKQSVHLTPSKRYASIYGAIDAAGNKHHGTQNVFGVYLTPKEMNNIHLKGGDGSLLHGYMVASDSYLHKGPISADRIHHIEVHPDAEKAYLSHIQRVVRAKGGDPTNPKHINHLTVDEDNALSLPRRAFIKGLGAITEEYDYVPPAPSR